MKREVIDVWDTATFDRGLLDILISEEGLIGNYITTENEIFLSHDYGRGPKQSALRPSNPYARKFRDFVENVGNEMQSRTIRAWHYTRLTDAELEVLRRDGIHLSTPESLRCRLEMLVASGLLSAELADKLFEQSPLQCGQLDIRANRFWMTSHPIVIDDSGVIPLMARWGGEVASMWVEEEAMLVPLAAIGKSCVMEVEVPMAATPHSDRAGSQVVASFGRSLGCISENFGFDLYVTEPLRPSAVVRVHSTEDSTFHILGRDYPEGYVNTHQTYWKDLTGEDD